MSEEQPKTDRDLEIHAEKSVKVEVVEQLANWCATVASLFFLVVNKNHTMAR